MPRYFTHYWKNETWEERKHLWESDPPGVLLRYAASNKFGERGVDPGDFLYPVTIIDGALYLLGKLEIDKVCDFEEAASTLGRDALWEADDYAIAAEPTTMHFNLEVPLEVTEQLTLISGNRTEQLKFSSPGRLDQQTLRGVRELRPQSAAQLDKLLSSAPRVEWGKRATFEVGRVYDRSREIHKPYGGQHQGGISTPRGRPVVLLFTSPTGEQYGYKDGWEENGVFLYTGEGQVGNQQFTHGTRAIRDHAKDGRDLHLFESLVKGKGYRYLGMFVCPTWEYRRGIDLNRDKRQVIVLHLVEPGEEEEQEAISSSVAGVPLSTSSARH